MLEITLPQVVASESAHVMVGSAFATGIPTDGNA